MIWISPNDRLPTKYDEDDFGEIYWCGKEYVCRKTVRELNTWDWSNPCNLLGHWAKTGVTRPSAPNTKDHQPSEASAVDPLVEQK
jgi:hypothetical protein